MRSISASMALFTFAIVACFLAAGCTQDLSRDQLAQKVGQPSDIHFFGDEAVYMGDQDGYRHVHVRELFGGWNFLGECDYKVPASEWPMEHPMPLTEDASKWQNVSWMNGDAPAGVAQNVFLEITPPFPLGAPKTQPATKPAHPASST